MTLNLQLPGKNETLRPTITVIGVGGAGGNAVNNMIASQLEGVNFVVGNTDAQALDRSLAPRAIQLGGQSTRGLGAGANPEVGRVAAEEVAEEIVASIEGSNMLFITAGMGGGTGTGAAPVVAKLARELGILTVAVVTKPFQFEGTQRMRLAEAGLKELQAYVDTLITIPNQNLFRIANERTTFADAFRMADEVLHSGVRGVTDLIVKTGLINLDFADIRTVMREMGKAMMGTGEAVGERRAIEAAEAAISNPLLDDVSLKGARAALINITGGPDMTLFEVDEAANRVRQEMDPEANIIFGSAFNETMEGRVRVSVIATGIEQQAQQPRPNPIEQRKPHLFAMQQRADQPPARPTPINIPASARPSFEIIREPVAVAPSSVAAAPAPVAAPVMPEPRMPASAPAPDVAFAEVTHVDVPGAAAQPQKEPVSAPVMTTAAPAEAPHISLSARREVREQAAQREYTSQAEETTRSLFARIAEVSRSLGGGARPEPAQQAPAEPARQPQAAAADRSRVEVVKKSPALPEDEQFLDIPAFLRRQAN